MSNIQDVRAINKPQFSYAWEVLIRGLSTGSLEDLTFFAKSVSIPQSAVEQVIVNHKSSKSHYAGRDSAAHTVTVTFWDDENLKVFKFFQEWFDNLIINPINGGSVPRNLYTGEMEIKLMNNEDTDTTGVVKLTNCFPIDLSDIPLSYDSSEPLEVSVTLSYDVKTTE